MPTTSWWRSTASPCWSTRWTTPNARLTAAAVRHAADFRQLHLYSALGDRLEEAADALRRASLILRERVLGEVVNG